MVVDIVRCLIAVVIFVVAAQTPAGPTNVRIIGETGVDCGAGNGNPICSATTTGLAGKGLTDANLTSGSSGNTTSNGQLIFRKLINGDVCVVHSNVIIRESRVNGQIKVGRGCVGGDVSVTGTLIEDTTINPRGQLAGISDITSTNSVFQRNDICCAQNFFTVWTGNNTKILSNYGHDESSNISAQHYDGIEAYCWGGTLTISNNSIYQIVGSGATAPLNVTPLGSSCGGTQLLVAHNVLRSANPGYVILTDDTQGGPIRNAIFNNNRLWLTSGGGYWYSSNNSTGNSHYNGTSNTNYNTGATIAVPTPH